MGKPVLVEDSDAFLKGPVEILGSLSQRCHECNYARMELLLTKTSPELELVLRCERCATLWMPTLEDYDYFLRTVEGSDTAELRESLNP